MDIESFILSHSPHTMLSDYLRHFPPLALTLYNYEFAQHSGGRCNVAVIQ